MTTSLEESARWAGAHQWAETRLFEILGAWVASTSEPELRLLLDRHSHHCAWRAGQWWDRLPVLAELDRTTACSPPSAAAAAAFEALAALGSSAARLAGAYRLALPRLWVAYDRHRCALGPGGPVADGASLRTLNMVQPDLAGDWHEGEAALQDLLGGGGATVGEAADAVRGLEALLVSG